jgi:uncharacterized protein YjbK
MTTQLEIELKQLIEKSVYDALIERFPDGKMQVHDNHYFRYSDPSLPIATRVRVLNASKTLTFKSPHPKGFLETHFAVNSIDVDVFQQGDVRHFLQQHHYTGTWTPLGTLTTQRYLIQWTHGELCLDFNAYLDHHDYEIEYEIQDGHEKEARSEFTALLNSYHLKHTQALSKYGRFLECAAKQL